MAHVLQSQAQNACAHMPVHTVCPHVAVGCALTRACTVGLTGSGPAVGSLDLNSGG